MKGALVRMLKALIYGAILTWAVAVVIGSQGSTGGPLGVHHYQIADVKVYWSWSMFLAGSGFSWALILLQR
jgi:hypothetical protein